MGEKYKRMRLDEPARYRIAIQGRLDEQWMTYFDGMTVQQINKTAILHELPSRARY
jgi:hypothetical protein